MRAIIVDDERLARKGLRRLLSVHPDVTVAAEAANETEAIAAVQTHAPDVIFLDVEMPGADGFRILEQLEEVPITIFTTAYDTYAVRAFEASALDYLVKPISAERLQSSLARVRRIYGPSMGHNTSDRRPRTLLHQLFVRDGDRCWIVRLADVCVMESEGNYTRLHFGNESPLIPRSLAAIAQRVREEDFFRTSRSHLVNLRKIERAALSHEGSLVLVLPGERQITVSRRQSRRLRELLTL